MKQLNTLSDIELLLEFEENCEKWGLYSCDCFGFYISAIQREITKRELRPMISIRTCSDKELLKEISDYKKHPEAFAYDQVPGVFQGYYLNQLIKECILRNLRFDNEDSNKS